MRTSRDAVYAAIDSERAYQDTRWNPETTSTGGLHTIAEWVLYMEDYIAEARTQLSRNADPAAALMGLNTIRKVAALAVACMEQHGAPRRAV